MFVSFPLKQLIKQLINNKSDTIITVPIFNNDIKLLATSLIGLGYIHNGQSQTTVNTSWPIYLGDSAAIERYRLMYT